MAWVLKISLLSPKISFSNLINQILLSSNFFIIISQLKLSSDSKIIEPIYKPSAAIASMKNFKSPNERSSYYIQWPIGKSLSSNVQKLNSTMFPTGFVRFDETPAAGIGLRWRFEYFVDIETKSTIISLERQDASGDDEGSIRYRSIPIICRFAMMNKVTGVMKHHVATFIQSPEFYYKWKISSDESRDLDLPNGDYVVYCWLDLPTKVIRSKSSSTNDPQGNCGPALLLSGVVSLFSEVVGRKTDESKGTSDIVLITNQGERKERRFNCHRNILSIRSPVFDTLVTNKGFKEGNEREVEIEEIDGAVLEIVLKYIYTGECPSKVPFASIPDVVDFAEKYMMPELKDECARQLFDYGDEDDDWAEHVSMAETYQIDYLKTISMLALSSNIRAMGEEEIRDTLSPEAMAELADMAAKRWALSKTMEVKNMGGW